MKRYQKFFFSVIIAAVALFPALAPAPPASSDAQLRKLADAKVAIALKVFDFFSDMRLGPPTRRSDPLPGMEQAEYWASQLVEARLDAATDKKGRVAILTEEVERTKAVEARIRELAEKVEGYSKIEAMIAEYNRLDAEYRLLKEKAE
jgi:predicted lipoprotein